MLIPRKEWAVVNIGSFNIITQEGEIHSFLVGKDYVYYIDFSFYFHSEKLGTEILCGKYPDWIKAMDDSDVRGLLMK